MSETDPYAPADTPGGTKSDKKAHDEPEKGPRSASDTTEASEAHPAARGRRKGHESPPK